MICQNRSITGLKKKEKGTIPVSDVDNGGAHTCVGARACGNSLYLLLDFVVNLKLF